MLPTDVGVSVHEVGPPGTAPAEVGGCTPQREHSMAQNAADKAGPPATPPPSTQQPATSAGAAAASSGGDHAASQLTAHSVSAVPKAEAALPGAAGVSGVDEDKRKKRLVLENMRLQKWRDMLANWETCVRMDCRPWPSTCMSLTHTPTLRCCCFATQLDWPQGEPLEDPVPQRHS